MRRALALLLLLSACSAGRKVAEDGRKIRVFYNNDNFAYLETCGCRVSPIGGVDRRWNAMKAYPDDSRIFLDAGNLLFKAQRATEFLAPQWYEQAVGVVDAYNLLGADAVEVGVNEFALGLDKFRELANRAKFPFISANILEKDSKKLFLRDSVILHRQGKKIGVFGLFGKDLPLPSTLEAQDPLPVAKRMVEKLRREGAEMVIALTHQGYDADVQLAQKVSGIDLIVGGQSQSLLQKPDTEGKTLIVQLSNQGQMLGMVEYDAATLTRTDFVVAELGGEFSQGPKDLANPMKSLVAVTNLRIQEANRGLDEKIWAEKFPEEISFETSITCRNCHEKQAAFHDGKAHSAAFLTLMSAKKERNLDCVKCHSVGFGMPGGFQAIADAFRDAAGKPVPLEKVRKLAGLNFPPPGVSYRADGARARADVEHWNASLQKAGVRKSFVSVQCENCHGAMPGHPFAGPHPGKVTVQACTQCHTPEQAPGWYKNGKLDLEKAQAAIAAMKCPR